MRAALRITAAILLTPILLFVAVIQIDQHLLRHRAEQLNADLQLLMRRPATWEDLQRIQTRWGRYGHYEGTCNRDHCAYRITLKGFPWRLYPTPWDEHLSWFHRAHRLAGINDTYVQSDLGLTRDRLWGVSMEVYAGDYRDEDSNDEALFARLVFGPRLFSYGFEQGIDLNGWKDGYITEFPGACSGCTGGYTSVTPSTPRNMFDRLTKVDFSCLTRFISCQAVAQILPAWKKHPFDAANWSDPHCLIPLDVRARETANIVLVQVSGNTPIADGKLTRWSTHVHILEKLKNTLSEQIDTDISFDELGFSLNPAPIPAPSEDSPSPPLRVGSHYFVLYPERRRFLSVTAPPEPASCSVALATPENLALIQSGIAQDPSAGEPYFLP